MHSRASDGTEAKGKQPPHSGDLMMELQTNTSNDNDTSSTRQFDAHDQCQATQQHST